MAFASLNPEQLAAATHGDGPLLVVAGAGTGKTATLAHRVAHLIRCGTAPSRILLLTFTRRAAAGMLRRVDAILAEEAAEARTAGRVWGGTFHATAARLLRLHGGAIGLHPAFTILDRGDSQDLLGVVRTESGPAKTERRFPSASACSDVYSRCVNSGSRLADVLSSAFPWCREHAEDLRLLFEAYVDRKERQRVLDYDDLLVFWRALLADPFAGPEVRSRFDAVLVDEYQDTNAVQAEILSLLAPEGRGLTAVGDDAQAIYSFRAATVRNILDFPKRFPGTAVVTLHRNYRSTPQVLAATNRVIELASERYPKELTATRPAGERPRLVTCQDEDEQAAFVATEALRLRECGTALRDQAVLFRAAHHSLALELELARRDIPFRKYGGLRFAETAHVKNALAFLRLAENPLDEVAAARVLALVPGVGPATSRRLTGALVEAGGSFAAWERVEPPTAAREAWPALLALMRTLAGAPPLELPAQLHAVRHAFGPAIVARRGDAASRLRDLEQLEASSARSGERGRFIAELALDPPSWTEDPAGTPGLDDDWLNLSTMHSAKGLEFDAVFVIHAADGNIPSDMAAGSAEEIEEERRLFYVACTRARDRLYVCHPLRYYLAGRPGTDVHGYSQLTRFMPERVAECFERTRAGGPDADGAAGSGMGATTTAGVRESLKASW
ncbi:MAG: ATP-dependent helicase [Coriobacteriia bacterium]|nr:ATP-dependent helicase [Coriobacteriia bacterium]